MRIIVLAFLLAGCANSLAEVRESPPELFTAGGTIESVSRCILEHLETSAPGYYKKISHGIMVPATYEIRQYTEQWEIISKIGENTGFLIIVERANGDINILLHKGSKIETRRASPAIDACK